MNKRLACICTAVALGVGSGVLVGCGDDNSGPPSVSVEGQSESVPAQTVTGDTSTIEPVITPDEPNDTPNGQPQSDDPNAPQSDGGASDFGGQGDSQQGGGQNGQPAPMPFPEPRPGQQGGTSPSNPGTSPSRPGNTAPGSPGVGGPAGNQSGPANPTDISSLRPPRGGVIPPAGAAMQEPAAMTPPSKRERQKVTRIARQYQQRVRRAVSNPNANRAHKQLKAIRDDLQREMRHLHPQAVQSEKRMTCFFRGLAALSADLGKLKGDALRLQQVNAARSALAPCI